MVSFLDSHLCRVEGDMGTVEVFISYCSKQHMDHNIMKFDKF